MTSRRRRWPDKLSVPIVALLVVSAVMVSYSVLQPPPIAASSTHVSSAPQPFRAGVLLVGFRNGSSGADESTAITGAEGHLAHRVGRTAIVMVPRGHEQRDAARLRAFKQVRYAEPDYLGELAAVPNDPSFGHQWPLQNTGQAVNGITGTSGADINATKAWDYTTGAASVVVGEVDTGVEYTHPDLAANIWKNPGGVNGCAASTHGYNVIAHSCDPMDDDRLYNGHGTHVAGIIAAVGNNATGVAGVGWRTTILPVKTVDANGNGATSDLITGLDWLVRAKQAGVNVRVVNDSQTWKGTAYSQALRDEIDVLGSNGILFVTAGGNTSDNNDDPAVRRYPCGYERSNELCAAATTQTDGLASFANHGATTVDLGAPGDNVYSTLRGGTYGYISGSSMAAAEVSGAAAVVLAEHDQTVFGLKAKLLQGAHPLGNLAGLVRTAARLDLCGALTGCAASIAGTAGVTSVGASSDTMSANKKRVNSIVLPTAAALDALHMYLAPTSTAGTQPLTGVVYADSGGSPGALLASTSAVTFSSTQQAGWVSFPFSTPAQLAAGTYWIGVLAGNTGGVTGFRWTRATNSRDYNTNTYTSGPSNPFGTPRVDSERMSLYASYPPATTSPPPPFPVTPPGTDTTAPTQPAPQQGQTVTATTGDWTAGPTLFGYQWARCSSVGTGCAPINGATSSTYVPTASDVGLTLQVRVTATGTSGATLSASPPTMVVLAGTSASPTPTASPTPSATPSPTPSPTASPTPSPTSSTSTFGVTTIGPNADQMLADRKRVNPATLTLAGSLMKLTIYLAPTGLAGSQTLTGVVYSDTAGAPDQLVAVTNPLTLTSNSSAGWFDLNLPSPVPLAAGRYWIGVMSGATSHVIGFQWISVAGSRDYNTDTYADGPSNPFGAATTDAELMSIYGTYLP